MFNEAHVTADTTEKCREQMPCKLSSESAWPEEPAINASNLGITLRGGEQSHTLINRLSDKGIRVVVATGDADVSLPLGGAAATLQKPMKEDALLASLRSENRREEA